MVGAYDFLEKPFNPDRMTELAKRAGISGAYLSQIESGVREGTGATLKKLAKALGVDLDLLIWGE